MNAQLNAATASEIALLAFLGERNAKSRAWAAEAPGRWASEYPETLQYIRARGADSVEKFVRLEKEATLWDVYKEAYGFRPRFMNISAMTEKELDNEIALAMEEISAEVAREKAREEAERAENEKLAARLGVDVATLERWGVIGEENLWD